MSEEPNKKVVVIDDDPSVQEVARAYLERDGYLVYVAGTAGEGQTPEGGVNELATAPEPPVIALGGGEELEGVSFHGVERRGWGG